MTSNALPLVSNAQWVPDSAVTQCAACQVEFGVITRKHHCRACGKIFCDSCSAAKSELADGGMHRVCVACKSRAQGMAGANSVQGGASAPQNAPSGPGGVQLPPEIENGLQAFQYANEINPKFLPSLRTLYNYDVVLICDDSGSMSQPADPEIPTVSRWQELRQSVAIVLRAAQAFQKPVDLHFINRGSFTGVTSFEQVAAAFQAPPGGTTNLVRVLNTVWNARVSADMSRPLIVHVFTDGHPTNDWGSEDIDGLANWLRLRRNIRSTFIAFLLCTDDEEIVAAYRPMEYRVRGQFGWRGPTTGIAGVDVTEDYRGEMRDIRQMRGVRYRFSFGDYIVKCLVGCVDPAVHAIDLPPGMSIYGDSGSGCSLM